MRVLPGLLEHESQPIRKSTLFCLYNIACGTDEQVATIIDQPGLIVEVLDLLTDGSLEEKETAAWSATHSTAPAECFIASLTVVVLTIVSFEYFICVIAG